MPSAHAAALYAGLRALDRKWWSAGLPPDARFAVRRAIRFDYRVAALDAAGALRRAARNPRTGGLGTALSSLERATLRWALTSARMEYWSRVHTGDGLSSPFERRGRMTAGDRSHRRHHSQVGSTA